MESRRPDDGLREMVAKLAINSFSLFPSIGICRERNKVGVKFSLVHNQKVLFTRLTKKRKYILSDNQEITFDKCKADDDASEILQ